MSRALRISTINAVIPAAGIDAKIDRIHGLLSDASREIDMDRSPEAFAAMCRASQSIRAAEAALALFHREIISAWHAIPDDLVPGL